MFFCAFEHNILILVSKKSSLNFRDEKRRFFEKIGFELPMCIDWATKQCEKTENKTVSTQM